MTIWQAIALGFMLAITPSMIVMAVLLWNAEDESDGRKS